MPRRVVVVDEPVLIRKAVCAILADAGFQIVADCKDGIGAMAEIWRIRPSIVVANFELPDMSGAELMRRAKRDGVNAKFILLVRERNEVVAAVQAGAAGVVEHEKPDRLVDAARAVGCGESYICSGCSAKLIEYVQAGPEPCPVAELSDREKQLVRLFGRGMGCKEAACALGLQVSTVRTYRRTVMRKLKVHSGAELVNIAIRHRLVSL